MCGGSITQLGRRCIGAGLTGSSSSPDGPEVKPERSANRLHDDCCNAERPSSGPAATRLQKKVRGTLSRSPTFTHLLGVEPFAHSSRAVGSGHAGDYTHTRGSSAACAYGEVRTRSGPSLHAHRVRDREQRSRETTGLVACDRQDGDPHTRLSQHTRAARLPAVAVLSGLS